MIACGELWGERSLGSRAVLYTRAGLEIGIAASKMFTTQLVALWLYN